MEIDTNKGNAGQSPFSRPPQPKTAPTFAAPRDPARASGPELSRSSATAPSGGTAMTAEQRQLLEGQRRSGAQWFYWVAGLSLINSVVALAGQDWRFILGLGVTQLIEVMARESGGAEMKAGIVGLAVIGLFAILGQRAVQGHQWAFVLGMVLYALDGAIFLMIQDWVGVGFHAFALVMIFRGYWAARQLPAADA